MIGIEENPVLANASGKGQVAAPVVASAASTSSTARKPKALFVEKDISDGPATQPTRVAQAPVVAAKPRPEVRQQAALQQAPAGHDAGRYSVQVGAFSQDENARKVKDKLVQSGYRGAKVERAVRGGRELSVVKAGSFSGREQAEEALRELRNEFPASFINTDV
ncbi:MAG: SPOR domain-containing protein [Humidesulfovibrio sp.]